jgi:uncharacterized protein
MEFILIPVIAFGAALLTFFSGFGLGTLLLPVFLLFFSIQESILLTASVHLLNNLFKGSLIGQHIHFPTLLRFGIPSFLGAWIGSEALNYIGTGEVLFSYTLGEMKVGIYAVNLAIGALMLFFTLFEIVPQLEGIRFGSKWMFPGGLISGFFGGFSGHQGALRSAFLIQTGLTKEAFIATGTGIAIGVDITRISNYLTAPGWEIVQQHSILIALSIGGAFIGSFIGKILLKKTTLKTIKKLVALFMGIIALFTLLGILN